MHHQNRATVSRLFRNHCPQGFRLAGPLVLCLLISWIVGTSSVGAADLDLWNESSSKAAILQFVETVTNESSPKYLPPGKRLAVFDMDGTILIEKPKYVLFDLAARQILDDIRENPALKEQQPYKAVAEDDWAHFGDDWYSDTGLYSVLLYAAKDATAREYDKEIDKFLDTVKHPRFGVSYRSLVFAPVVQLIDYLQTNQFDVYICSGSTVQFIRSIATDAAHIPAENVIGSTILATWEKVDGQDAFVLQKEFIQPINDEAGKPVNIRNRIGKVPVIVVGNSLGDYHMLEYSKTAPHSIQLVVNHDDAEREYAYKTEQMKKACEENGWIEISMKNDFKIIFDQP